MISLPAPLTQDFLVQIIQEILRRAVDGTVVPLFIDYNNQRVIIGGISASVSPAKVEIASGSLKVVTQGQGVILRASNSSNYYMIGITEVTNDDGTVSPVFTATKQ